MTNDNIEIRSLEDLNHQKELLKSQIEAQDRNIKKMWASLFHDPEKKVASTPSARLAKVISIGSGVFDGALLGWKLYRKFKK